MSWDQKARNIPSQCLFYDCNFSLLSGAEVLEGFLSFVSSSFKKPNLSTILLLLLFELPVIV